jgi:hypothetical protein
MKAVTPQITGTIRGQCPPLLEGVMLEPAVPRGPECVEDARRIGRPPDFIVQLRIQSAIEEGPLASV